MSQNMTPAPQRFERVVQVLHWLRETLLNNWPLKLLSLVLALALWTGLITQDPTLTREKSFRDVPVTVNNADILKRNGYIVTSDLEALLSGVDMTVEVPQMQYSDATPANYNIRVDLNRLAKKAGEQELVIATTNTPTYGAVTRVSPATITVTVEEYVTHSYIPVNVVQLGEAPEGFYAAGVTKDPSWITVSGPRSLVEKVDRAQVVLDMSKLSAKEGPVEHALAFTLLDEEGEAVESDMLQVTRESVLRERINVTVTLYTKRDVPVQAAQLYVGEPAEGYEVADVYVTPSYVTIAGLRSVVDSVDLLQTGKLANIRGAQESVTATIDLAKPLNLQWMSTSKVNVTVVIRPVQRTVSFTDVPVRFTGLAEGLQVAPDAMTATVRVTGSGNALTDVTQESLQITCDLTGLAAGEHEVPLQCAPMGDCAIETEPQMVKITILAEEN